MFFNVIRSTDGVPASKGEVNFFSETEKEPLKWWDICQKLSGAIFLIKSEESSLLSALKRQKAREVE